MKISRTSLLSLGLVALAFAFAALLYDRLPEAVPTHWNAAGVADGFTPKPWGPFILPLVMAGVSLLLMVVPHISPRGYRVQRFQQVYEIIQTAILAFLLLVNVLVLLSGIGAPVAMDRAVLAGTGLLFVVLGNFMGKLTKNFFIGIRTPWTLASDEVWLRTHRLGGWLFVLAGISLFFSGLLGWGGMPLLAAIAIACGVPAIYSYVLYRRIEGLRSGSPDEETTPTAR